MTSAELISKASQVAGKLPLADRQTIEALAERHDQLLSQALKMERWIHGRIKQDEDNEKRKGNT